MCGIFGKFVEQGVLDQKQFKSVSEILAHRGPDAEGFFFSQDRQLGLGHRRLSVIDLRDIANQPMSSADGNWTITYNGEVFNYREVRQELMEEGVGPFKTDSDTEVVLLAWMHWGPFAVEKFNGMFAFAIWDQRNRDLWLCRDRLGIKPLFYSCEGGLSFASELKGIFPLLTQPLTRSNRAIAAFLHLGFIPEPDTVYEEIKKFPSGHYGCYKGDKQLELVSYWKPEEKIGNRTAYTEKEALDAVESAISSSVKYRTIADVPFGTFLSGGTDSSLVTAIAAKLTSKPLLTFSIGFKEGKYDESKYAARVARQLGTEHAEFILSEREAMPLLEDMLATFDEPFADTSAIPTMMVSRLAREKATVILTGDGGDELFMGYGSYKWAQRLSNPLVKAMATPTKMLLSMGSSRYRRVAGLLDLENDGFIRSHIFSQEQYFFSSMELKAFLRTNDHDDFYKYRDPLGLARKLSAAELQALFDLKVYLKDDLLTKVDRASMKYGLECRVPLLDYRLVELALNLPETFKKRGQSKWILKKILERHLPKELIYRPKWGFSVPLSRWLRGELKYLIDEYLNDSVVEAVGVVNATLVKKMIERFMKGDDYLYSRIWVLIVLHHWVVENQQF
ncbi:MAG: asparagine synthase (glutamine-hydrolyzing) [Imperialibacter sp.]|uniref:asparagine synthase (glutamine-hydrolyzing) n=1 Tax=Imperialibacter sp. TaxID=2038411 RepID=UPI0032EF868A